MLNKEIMDLFREALRYETDAHNKKLWLYIINGVDRMVESVNDLAGDHNGWKPSLMREAAEALKDSNPELSKRILDAEEHARYVLDAYNMRVEEPCD